MGTEQLALFTSPAEPRVVCPSTRGNGYCHDCGCCEGGLMLQEKRKKAYAIFKEIGNEKEQAISR